MNNAGLLNFELSYSALRLLLKNLLCLASINQLIKLELTLLELNGNGAKWANHLLFFLWYQHELSLFAASDPHPSACASRFSMANASRQDSCSKFPILRTDAFSAAQYIGGPERTNSREKWIKLRQQGNLHRIITCHSVDKETVSYWHVGALL